MLVLTRRQGESIVVGNDIRITVVALGPGRVKLGIDAPPQVRVDREEVHARIVQEQGAPEQTDVLAAVAAEMTSADNGSNTSLIDKTAVVPLSQRKPR